MDKTHLLKGLCAVGLITVPQAEAEAQENTASQEKRPNIIFILKELWKVEDIQMFVCEIIARHY